MVEFLLYLFIDPSIGDIVHNTFHYWFPIFFCFSYCALLLIPFLMSNNILFVKLKTLWVFLPSGVVSSNLSPSLHGKCFQSTLSFCGERFVVRNESGLAILPIFFCSATPSPASFIYSSKSVFFLHIVIKTILLPAAEW